MEYDPRFAIRGLHYDIEKGLLLKLDSFLQIQLGSVYRGLTPVTDAEVIRLYRNRSVPLGKLIYSMFSSRNRLLNFHFVFFLVQLMLKELQKLRLNKTFGLLLETHE